MYWKQEAAHVFESTIDLLSFVTLEKLREGIAPRDNLLSLAGVYQPSMSRALSQALGDDYQIRDEPPKFGKDMNDELVHMRQKMAASCSPVDGYFPKGN